MTFQTAVKALELKNLIDHAHKYLPDIGRCISVELDFRREHMDPEEEDEEDEENSYYRKEKAALKLEKLQNKLVSIYNLKGYEMEDSGFEDCSITVLGKEIQCLSDISLEDVEKWYAAGASSGFGNVMKQETQHDTHVRSSRELDTTQFTVSQEILDGVALKWGQKFVLESITAQPYKIVIYGPGDHFQFHKDTPEDNLCGTFLISLYGCCSPSYAFEICQHEDSSKWSGYENNGWCAFYPDIPHRVEPLKSGFRAILSFKLYAKNQKGAHEWDANVMTKRHVESFVEELQTLDISVGILLNHHYGYESKSIYGCDKLLLGIFERKGLKVDMKPVLIRFHGEGRRPNGDYSGYEGSGSLNTWVYSITDEDLDYVRKRLSGTEEEERFKELHEEILFLDGESGSCEGLWKMEIEQEIEYTGNESQPHSEKSVYVRYAAILRSTEAASQED